MDSKPKIDLSEIFSQTERRKFLYKFDVLVRHLSRDESDGCRHAGGQCHDINLVVSSITENLIRIVAKNEAKFEASLYSLPWAKYLLNSTPGINRLNCETFARLLVEYVQIFPNKSDKFIDSFLFILRGNKDSGDDVMLSVAETHLFSVLRSTLETLLKNIHNFEPILVEALKKRFPYFHNSNVHEFACYTYNLMNISELLSPEFTLEIFNLIFKHMIQIDTKFFFDGINDSIYKENVMFEFEDLHSTNQSVVSDEGMKKCKVLDASMNLFFEYIDSKLKDGDANAEQLMEIVTSFFFKHITSQPLSSSDILHLQYLVFYLCARSREYCDVLVNDLWTCATSGDEPLVNRESCLSFLISLILHAKFVNINTVFSFLKILIQAMNSYLDSKPASNSSDCISNNDIMYYNLCIGFCRLFCTFHSDLERIQIECLKNMDLKRALMNHQCNPMHFLPGDLREFFKVVVGHYRIGYYNVQEMRPRSLAKMSTTHRDDPPKFGRIRLTSVKTRIAPYVRSIDVICDVLNTSSECGASGREQRFMSNNWLNSPTSNGRTSKTFDITPNTSRYSLKARAMLATSPTTNTSGDDGMLSSPNSFTPSSNLIMAHMLSDIEAME